MGTLTNNLADNWGISKEFSHLGNRDARNPRQWLAQYWILKIAKCNFLLHSSEIQGALWAVRESESGEREGSPVAGRWYRRSSYMDPTKHLSDMYQYLAPSHLTLPNNQSLSWKPVKPLLVIAEVSGYPHAPTRPCSGDFRVGLSLVVLTRVHSFI